jgi:hypothetical protein
MGDGLFLLTEVTAASTYYPFSTPDYQKLPLGGVESSADNIFVVGDQVKIDAGAIKVRLR